MLSKIRKMKDKHGFTLVELIVVLVILAILAALLVPALTGYIDKAKEKTLIAETRQVVMATQTLVDEAYAKKKCRRWCYGGCKTCHRFYHRCSGCYLRRYRRFGRG